MPSSKLSKFRADAPPLAENPDVPSKLVFHSVGKVLAFDQSLSNTGWAWLWFTIDGPAVMDTGNIVTEPLNGITGYSETFLRATQVYREVVNVIAMVKPTVVLHEMPSVRPNPRANLKDRDGSIATIMSIRCAAVEAGCLVDMQQAQHVKKVLCGDAKATKKQVAEAVRYNIPTLSSTTKKLRLNEHTHDAMAIGLVYASEEH